MQTPKRYLVTSALPYANGPQHFGHLAGAYIPADVYVRYLRMMGEEVLFICGSDEHGAAITLQAKKEGNSPRDIIDKYHPINKAAFQKLGISFDIYHRTSDPLHHETSKAFFKVLHEKGIFVEKESEQFYDEEYNQFLADRYIKGTCPKCANENAYGDQCEKCGSDLSPTELINPLSTLSGKQPVLKTTKHWYLPMGKFQDAVKKWVDESQTSEKWKKHVLGQCNSWLDQGLNDRSMTRDLDWGVEVPLPDAEGKVLYVWLDAPIGYISATKALTDDWATYWQSEDTKLVHFIGKDNIVFHCIIFPMLLQLHGDYVLPTNIPANQFMNLEGDKMSTSRNYAVWLYEYLKDFPDMEDVLRYALISNMPENKDSDFSWKDFQARNNNELVGILGNLVNRVLVLTHKYFDGTIPAISEEAETAILQKAEDVYDYLMAFPHELDKAIHHYEFRNGLKELINLARVGNKFLTDLEPWKLVKQDKEQTAKILAICLELIARLGVYAEPFLPFTAAKIKDMLNLDGEAVQRVLKGSFRVKEGYEVSKPTLLFKKLDDKVIQPQIDKLQAIKDAKDAAKKAELAATDATYEPVKDTISYEDFSKLDIRTGTILTAEKIKKANKLLKLTVDLGFEVRTVVSGIAKQFDPEAIIGQKVLFLANLAPRKMRGVESQGMILMAASGEKLGFVAAMDEEMGNGLMIS